MAIKTAGVTYDHPADYRDEIAAPAGRVRFLEVPRRQYLLIDGEGQPGGDRFRDAIGSLYPVAYTLHFALKRKGIDAPVGALEGLFSFDSEGKPGSWRLLLPVPDAATEADVDGAIDAVRARKSPPLIDEVRCESWEEGPSAQVMHIGPYAAEPATIELLDRAIAEEGLTVRGRHHEIYISDPNRTRPERMKTVVRKPVG